MYKYRFEIFFLTLMLTLFGSIIFPASWFESTVFPLLLLLNIGAGIVVIAKKKKTMWFFLALFSLTIITIGKSFLQTDEINQDSYIRLAVNFLFYAVITIEIIKQVWGATLVNRNIVVGLMSGYICLGLMAFFVFSFIEFVSPGSFQGLLMVDNDINSKQDSLIYYSYVTLLTIGYGEIIPISPIAQKVAVLTGLMGQFYIVIITAVIIEKYIQHSKHD